MECRVKGFPPIFNILSSTGDVEEAAAPLGHQKSPGPQRGNCPGPLPLEGECGPKEGPPISEPHWASQCSRSRSASRCTCLYLNYSFCSHRHKKDKKKDKEREKDRDRGRKDVRDRSQDERERSTSKKSKDKDKDRDHKSDSEKGDVKVRNH